MPPPSRTSLATEMHWLLGVLAFFVVLAAGGAFAFLALTVFQA